MIAPGGWDAVLEVDCGSAPAAIRLYRVLAPEAAREVPRARAELGPPVEDRVELRVWTRDTGALRAAVQTYLGWVQLEAAAERAGAPGP
jgi:tRNA threonylcarbamoyladenosine modification (KEOPS) complex  Pcc1 subunit